MKKLLVSAAILALGVSSTPSMAQDESGVKLGLGGFASLYGSYVDQDTAAGSGVHKFDILRDTEMHFTGETTLDNGLTVGAHMAATVDSGDSFDLDETFVFFSGNWGKIDLGVVDSVTTMLQVAAPAADENVDGVEATIWGVNYGATTSTDIGGVIDEIDYDHDTTDLGDKIAYYTPVMSGFQAGLAYTPEATTTNSRSLNGNASNNNAGDLGDAIDIAARYEGEMNGVGFAVGTGYTTAKQEVSTATSDDFKQWNAGLDLNIGDMGLGAAYLTNNNGESVDDKNKTYVVGVDYTVGAVRYGASYLNQDRDLASLGTGTLETDKYTIGAVYDFAPGMSFRGSVSHIKHDGSNNNNDVKATNVLIGTSINF